MLIRRGGTRDPLQPGEWIEVHYEEAEGEMQLQARFVEYQIFTEDRAAVYFIRVQSDDCHEMAWINLDTVKSIRRIGPGN
ncbi:hypothetical protein ACVNS2_16770 [Paenibacillus caseinilyticus]|uniref:Uncharacterized protein n=1 Tax=Paenibacillus mucilaginosus K02 TaxID=997761 RepID=I0BIV3_9BACL|nr:hypothetical protein [Paenibacillus mucilaginosus]AFH62300.1 hypothetical protein B2K_16490 [Paenibacillus mucilaginosus K02]